MNSSRAQLVPGTGQGFVPLESREVEFAQRTGYTLQHIEQFSSCTLPLDTKLVADLQAEADEANNGRYRLHHWTDRCPDRWLEAVAALENQAGADVDPALDAPVEQDMVFDGAILRKAEEVAIAQGRRTVVTAVEHIATGTLVGLTTISVLAHRADVVFQDDTVVLQEHRGNKLGLLIKVANMERLTEQFPAARIIYTWNAPENRYLLTVNQQLGSRRRGHGDLAKGAPAPAHQQQLGPRFGALKASPVDLKDQRPSVVGNPLSRASLNSAVVRERAVDFWTKDPEHRAAGAGERSKAPRNNPR
jgi:hypothetical protein